MELIMPGLMVILQVIESLVKTNFSINKHQTLKQIFLHAGKPKLLLKIKQKIYPKLLS